ncbi:helix-turn-helix domain-containing protein [Bailinhaonella thermotolerans]|uniref:Transcription regulator TrmB N-terminal domain-containing protein n=1 Tax=Bailinhaonella thermotolerans TaxID=1070861 RepID=A0A3A4B1K7_9ACTN|nr:helix-turn-helix domain-containing protein [Bailinhaonella thermotolerans]RJL31290.1 hypothetical protein D5H75_19725 [Bailinhaonella thermotolerans]
MAERESWDHDVWGGDGLGRDAQGLSDADTAVYEAAVTLATDSRATADGLARLTGMEPAAVESSLGRLVDRGWLKRESDSGEDFYTVGPNDWTVAGS